MSQVFSLWWSSWKHHVTERACRRVHDVLSFLFRSTKTIKHLQLYNKNNHNYNPTTHNHLGPIWSLPGPRWSSLDTDESHSIFQARPRFRYPTSVAFGMGLLGQSPKSNLPTVMRFVTFWWGCSENPALGNLKLDLWIHLFGYPTHHAPSTTSHQTPSKTCEESHPTSAGGVLLSIEPDVLQSPLNSASAKRPCRNTKSEQERIWFFFTGLECEVSGFEDLWKGSWFSSVSICASYWETCLALWRGRHVWPFDRTIDYWSK